MIVVDKILHTSSAFIFIYTAASSHFRNGICKIIPSKSYLQTYLCASHGFTAKYNTLGQLLFSEEQHVLNSTITANRLFLSHLNNPSLLSSCSPFFQITKEEKKLFLLFNEVLTTKNKHTIIRVAGGWVRDKLLLADKFPLFPNTCHRCKEKLGLMGWRINDSNNVTFKNVTSNINSRNEGSVKPSSIPLVHEKNIPVDIDITLDDMLGREFAKHLNEHFSPDRQSKVFVGVVLCNPEKSKHLETAKVHTGQFCIDLVNLRAEEYSYHSRIPETIQIGTAREDAYRRDFTINTLFYNLSTCTLEDWTGRGLRDLKRRLISTPLPPLMTLLDDPLRVIRAVRFATRLKFYMDNFLKEAAMDRRVRVALEQKVSRERIGSEIDQMLRGRDPAGAIKWLVNLRLIKTVFPIESIMLSSVSAVNRNVKFTTIFESGLNLLTIVYERVHLHLLNLVDDSNLVSKLWYASFFKPLVNYVRKYDILLSSPRKIRRSSNFSVSTRLMVDHLKRPVRDAETVERIIRAADDFTTMLLGGSHFIAIMVIREGIRVVPPLDKTGGTIKCFMRCQFVNSEVEKDPTWIRAMEFRLQIFRILNRVGNLWRPALLLSLSEQLSQAKYNLFNDMIENTIKEEELIVIYNSITTSVLQLGLCGTWSQKLLIDGREIKYNSVLPNIPNSPKFREIMDKQKDWMVTHPTGGKKALVSYLREEYSKFV